MTISMNEQVKPACLLIRLPCFHIAAKISHTWPILSKNVSASGYRQDMVSKRAKHYIYDQGSSQDIPPTNAGSGGFPPVWWGGGHEAASTCDWGGANQWWSITTDSLSVGPVLAISLGGLTVLAISVLVVLLRKWVFSSCLVATLCFRCYTTPE